jgi:uracil-DNA glycosylase
LTGDRLDALEAEITACRACPRLVAWREEVGRVRRRAFADQEYWARPVPGFGDADPWLVLVGLAPSAHGANRTGRVFTGDPSGDVLFAALHRAGLASQPRSTGRGDGMRLRGCRITAAVRCAPPDNRPMPDERDRCRPFLVRELEECPNARVVLALGAVGWEAARRAAAVPRPWPRFGHGAEAPLAGRTLLGSYHPSPQNVSTGRLTPAMLDDVLARAAELTGT